MWQGWVTRTVPFADVIKTLLDVKRVHMSRFIKFGPLALESIANKQTKKQIIYTHQHKLIMCGKMIVRVYIYIYIYI